MELLTNLSGGDDAWSRTLAGAGRYPRQSWRDLRIDGTISFDLAGHLAVAGRRGEDVQAFGAQRRYHGTPGAIRQAEGEGAGPDWEDLPGHRHSRGWSRRLRSSRCWRWRRGACIEQDREARPPGRRG